MATRVAQPSTQSREAPAGPSAPPESRVAAKLRAAEARLFDELELDVRESFVEARRTGLRLRVLTCGEGEPAVLLHGVTMLAAGWAPLLSHLRDYTFHAVDLPGHGLSDEVDYRRVDVREHGMDLVDDVFDALALDAAPVVAHSLGAMFVLWHAAARAERVATLLAPGCPAGAFPGTTARFPLSALSVRGLGTLMLRSPSTPGQHRRIAASALGKDAIERAPDALLDALRISGGRAENARTVGRLMPRLLDGRRPRPYTVMTPEDLQRVAFPVRFLWGREDRFADPEVGRRGVDELPHGELIEVPGGHAPWLDDAEGCARFTQAHLDRA